MKRKEAQIIALRYIVGWASLNVSTNEDFYDYIPPHYLTETPVNGTGEFNNEHFATDEERKLIAKYFKIESDKLYKRIRKLIGE